MTNLEWDQIQAFLHAVRAGTMTGAGKLAGVSQATMSRRIAALEQALDQPLFERSRDGLTLTEAGEQALARAEAMDHAAHELGAALAGLATEPEGMVRISAPPGLALELPELFARTLRPRYPKLRIEVLSTLHNVDLVRGEADIAIRMTAPRSGDLIVRKAPVWAQGIFAHPSYVASLPPGVGLAGLDWISFAEDMAHVPAFAWLQKQVPGVEPVVMSSDLGVQRRAAQAGLGVLIIAEIMASSDGLVPVPVAHPKLAPLPFSIVYPTRLRLVARVRVVVEALLGAR